MNIIFFRSSAFWIWAIPAGLLSCLFFVWELGMIPSIPFPPRPEATNIELIFTVILIIFITLNAGLLNWRRKTGSCPVGTKRATGLGGTVGAIALLCPACLLLPISLFGISVSLTFLGPFLPLLRIIALTLLIGTTSILLPKKH